MKFIIYTLLISSVMACTSTKVHLYSRYLSPLEVQTISKALENVNFEVMTNSLSFPDTVSHSTLLYSPFIQDEAQVDNVINALTKLGWVIPSIHSLVSGNHWYKKNSIGLFLLPEGLRPNDKIAQQDLANTYESRNCSTSVKIHLNADHTYQLVFDQKSPKQADYHLGTWQMRSYPYLELTSHSQRWWFYFKIEQYSEIDKISEIEFIELQPEDKYSVFPDCSFIFGIRK